MTLMNYVRWYAGYLADNKIVGWFQNRSEFGPRALGSRSILDESNSIKEIKIQLINVSSIVRSGDPLLVLCLKNIRRIFPWTHIQMSICCTHW